MFHFGSTEDVASLYFTKATSGTGPGVPDSAIGEMSEEDLRILLTYRRMAYSAARADNAPQGVCDALLEAYDEVFKKLVEVSERFREIVKTGVHRPITGFSAKSINKYRVLAGHEPLTNIR